MTDTDSGRRRDGAVLSLQLPEIATRGIRIFSASRGRQRFRRASDVLLLAVAAAGLATFLAAYPPSRLERSLISLLASLPGWLDPLWSVLYDGLAVLAVLLVGCAVALRRWRVAALAGTSVAIAAGVAIASARIVIGDWPGSAYVLELGVDEQTFPVLRVAACAAAILAISPDLVRPLQALVRWALALGIAGGALVDSAAPSACVAAFFVALLAATAVRLVFGTSAGRPETRDVVAALRELGVAVERLEPAARQPAGSFVARGIADDGSPLLIKVYGRDAYDTHLLARLGRSLWFRGEAPRIRLGRLQAVEHEALVTLLAAQAGVPTRSVVMAGESSWGDALLVLRESSRPLAELSDELLERSWVALGSLAEGGIAHQRIGPDTLVTIGDTVGFVDFDHATLAPGEDQLQLDRAQLLATTSTVAGVERAVTAAVRALGADAAAALLPYLQPAAFRGPLRRALADAEVEADELRGEAARAVGAEAPELIQFRRVTWWTLGQLSLLALAVSALVGAASGLDYEELRTYLQDASWWWIALGALVAQAPRLTQALSTLGSVPAQIPFVPVYAMQLATGYMNLALPSNFARMAINIRFFQRQGIPPTVAVTGGAIDSFASTVIQALLLGSLLLFTGSTLETDFETPSGSSLRALAAVAAVGVAAVVALALVSRIRNAVTERIRRWWPEVRAALRALRASHKLALLVGGSLATEILFAAALGVFANAFGYDIAFTDLLVINISVSLLASLLPVPGGIGVVEFGLTAGLVAVGMPDEAALTTALLYRVATFYLPPVWGFFAMRWLQRTSLL